MNENELDSEQKYWLTIWLGVMATIGLVAICSTIYNCYALYQYTKEGYEEAILPGSSNAHWVKK